MSKSLGNYVGVDDPPNDMYGKVMSIPDDLIMDYFELLTDVPEKELAEFKQQLAAQSVNPMILKKRLGREIVLQFHGTDAAKLAEANFEREVQGREVPQVIRTIAIPSAEAVGIPMVLVDAELVKSRSEARRLIRQGAVEIDGQRITEDVVNINENGAILKVGKRRFLKITIKKAEA